MNRLQHRSTFLATYHVEVQSVDANAWVILDAQVNVLLDTEAKVSSVGEVVLSQLVLTHL